MKAMTNAACLTILVLVLPVGGLFGTGQRAKAVEPETISSLLSQVDAIVDFVWSSYEAGTLQGTGNSRKEYTQVEWIVGQVETAGAFIQDSDYAGAYTALENAYLRMDGEKSPRDTVTGPAVAPLATMILDLMQQVDDLSAQQHTVAVYVVGSGSVAIWPDQATYTVGDVIELTAYPDPGWDFAAWSGDLTGTTNPTSLTVTGDLSITATFEALPPTGTVVTDDFNGTALDTDVWTFVNPRADASVAVADSAALISVPADIDHDPWKTNMAPRILRAVPDADFEIATKFNSIVAQRFQMQGLLVEQDVDTYLRFDTYSDGTTVRIYAASFDNGKASVKVNSVLSGGTAPYLAVQRAGDLWTYLYSYDGISWLTAGSFSQPLAAQSAGCLAGNASNSGANAPAFLCAVDYFSVQSEALSPPPADCHVTINLQGNGQVTRSPDLPTYEPGQLVELAAYPDPGWDFAGWSGDLNSTSNPVVVTVMGDMEITALFQTMGDAVIDVWYGDDQVFGQWGICQPWANVLGSVANPETIMTLTYALNGGPQVALSMGPQENLRLAGPGDFNVELAYADLVPGLNELVIAATDTSERRTTQAVTVEYVSGNTWPLPYSVEWATVDQVTDVVQVVDGWWELGAGGVRSIETGYDRNIALGDLAWDDYEMTVPVTVNRINIYSGQPGGKPAVGIIMRWQGHYDWGLPDQPRIGWYPCGALGWFKWGSTIDSGYYQIIGSGGLPEVQDDTGLRPELGVNYLWKMRVETLAGGGSRYQLKVWAAEAIEPTQWLLTYENDPDDPPTGSVLLVSHHADVTLGDIVVQPLP